MPLLAGLCLTLTVWQSGDVGLSPEEALGRMTLPDGFRAELFASEPEIRQPVAACFDERGRLWVVEYLQYPNPAGLTSVTVDQYLRTEYDRVPGPPPDGPRGADRIKVLEDTNGDGRADKVTTFVEGLNLASAIAVGHGGVFVGQAPYLLFYPDQDRDDRPDGAPDVLLTGFGLQDAHAVVNSLTWGPDGWLYGAQGSTVTARIEGNEFQQGIWRYHPVTKRFELFAEGGGNTWGLDFDATGHAFGSSNGGFVAFHMVQGGSYWKGFAKHGPLHNPRAYGYFDALAYDGPKRGGHVTPGGIIYQGDAYPEGFRGTFVGGNLLSNAVYWHELTPLGSTFRARHGGTLIESNDPWFRPIDLLTGPDGCVHVVDWYDKRASHLDPRDNWDKSNGRIYRVVHGERPPLPTFDLATWSTEALIDLRTHANAWWPDTARRVLAERRDAKALPRLRALLLDGRDEVTALRDLWALRESGGWDEALALRLLDHPVASVRRWTVRFLGDDGPLSDVLGDRVTLLAAQDDDPAVLSQLASSAQRWPSTTALRIVTSLAGRSELPDDPHVPLLAWWAMERALRDDAEAAVEALLRAKPTLVRAEPNGLGPRVQAKLLEGTARALVSGGDDAGPRLCARLLTPRRNGTGNTLNAASVLAGMEKGLAGRGVVEAPPSLLAMLGPLTQRPEAATAALSVAARLGDTVAYAKLVARLADSQVAESDQLGVLEFLGQVRREEGLDALLDVVRDKRRAESLRLAAITALGGYDAAEVAEFLLTRYPEMDGAMRAKALGLLMGRQAWASLLLDAIEEGRVAATDVATSQVLALGRVEDASLRARVEAVWGRAPGPGSPETLRRIAEVRGILPEGDKGDAGRGRDVFRKACAGCHALFGEGERIGPDLTGVERGDLEFLLTSVIDPSAVVRKEFQSQSVALKDGRVLSGLVVAESDASLTLFDSQAQRTTLARVDIEAMRPSDVSLMPEGLLDVLPEDQVRDLFRYLQMNGPSVR